MPTGMKGLTSFVSDIRNCQSRDSEKRRVDKELAKIRVKFSNDKLLTGYDRKKYVWKLLYAYILGYDIDFGHIQAVNLCSSIKYSEKVAGYLACSLLLSDSPDVLRLIINVCKSDLQSKSDPVVALALHALANIGGPEFSENLFPDVSRLFTSEGSAYLRKKAALCLLRLHRRDPELLSPPEWVPRIVAALDSRDVGFLTATASLLIGLLESSKVHPVTDWIDCLRPSVLALSNMVSNDCPSYYVYYSVPAPWLQVKLLRIIQHFPVSAIDEGLLERIKEILSRVITKSASTPPGSPNRKGKTATSSSSDSSDRLNKMNAEKAIFFEAILVMIHFEGKIDPSVRRAAANLLGTFVSSPEANTRYLGLEAMARLADNAVNGDVVLAASEHKLFDKFKNLIAAQMHESDVSIRRQALNLLYVICDKGNWQSIVDELLEVLSARTDAQMEEELVLKIAILAENNAPDPTWYIDVVIKMFEYAPDSVGEQVWFRAVQVVVNADDGSNRVALHAASKAYEALGGLVSKTTYPHESMMRLCTYLLGEFGYLLVQAKKVTALRLVELLRGHFQRMSARGKGICLLAFGKILNSSPSNKLLRDEVIMHIESLKDSSDPDLQQRSCELMHLITKSSDTLLEKVLAVIPPLSGGIKENPLIARLKMQTKSRAASRQALEIAPPPLKSLAPQVAASDSASSSSSDDDSSDYSSEHSD